MIGIPASPWVRAEDSGSVGAVRETATRLAVTAGFDAFRAGRVAVAVGEAVSGLVEYAQEVVVTVRPHPWAANAVEFVAIDRGPGVPSVAHTPVDGCPAFGTPGIGLGAIARLAAWHEIYSAPGRGTILAMCFTPTGEPPPSHASGLLRPIGEEPLCGDAFALHETGSAVSALVCDGIGHGAAAAQAAREAVRIFKEAPGLDPADIVARVHDGLGHTRGGAVAVARVDREDVVFSGLGNVSGWIVHPAGRHGMVSLPGIAGHRGRRPQQFRYPLPRHATTVLHSDGLTGRWDPVSLPGLSTRSSVVVAAALLREAGSPRDDSCVVAVRSRS